MQRLVAGLAFALVVALVCCEQPKPLKRTQETAPESLVYEDAPFTLSVGVEIVDPFLPTVEGGTPVNFTVSPALPGGLVLDIGAGTLAGKPEFVSPKQAYTVIGSNGLGSVETTFDLEVIDPNAATTMMMTGTTGPTTVTGSMMATAPSGLAYPLPDASYVINNAITMNTPSVSGTAPFTFAISPVQPAGLSFDTTTGTIAGTPTILQARTPYTVTATNNLGMTSTMIHIEVASSAVAPVLSGYTDDGATYSKGVQITDNVPIVSGTPPLTYTLLDPLPAGLSLQSDGKITGTPTAATALGTYRVKVENGAGSSTFAVTLTVIVEAPSLTFPASAVTFGKGGTIDTLTPTVTGSPPFTFGVANLPPGLVFHPDGTITGAPSATGVTTTTITATNSAGSDPFDIDITVVELIAYPATAFVYITPGTAIPPADVSPTILAPNHLALTVTPAMPNGLQVHPTNGNLFGPPTALSPVVATNYVVSFESSTTPGLRGKASFSLQLVAPSPPAQPTGSSGVVSPTGVYFAANMAGASAACTNTVDPPSPTIQKGGAIGFKLMSQDFAGSWTNSITPAPGWPSLGCYLLTNVGSTCVFGVNDSGTFTYDVHHNVGGGCAKGGTITVNP